jgi:uncharacterized repeat protein (TIGR04076 family)
MKKIDLGLKFKDIKSYDDYKNLWENMSPVQIEMIEKNESCKHKLGDVFVFDNPYSRPEKICNALMHVVDLYLWRSALGFPSWNEKDRSVFEIHCPDRKGTVWEMKRISRLKKTSTNHKDK